MILLIGRLDTFIITMEEKLRASNQFFYIADLSETSSGSRNIIGFGPDRFDLSTFITRSHPDDQARQSLCSA